MALNRVGFCSCSAKKSVLKEVMVVNVEALVLKGVRSSVTGVSKNVQKTQKGKTTDEGLL